MTTPIIMFVLMLGLTVNSINLKRLIFLLVIAKAVIANASDNDSLIVKYKLASDGSLSVGNVDRILWISRIGFSLSRSVVGFQTDNLYRFGDINKQKSERDLTSRTFLHLFQERKSYCYGMGVIETSLRREIDFRWQLGLGSGFYFVRNEHQDLRFTLTILREKTTFDSANFEENPGTSNIRQVWRATLRLVGSHDIFNGKLICEHESWFQPALNDRDDYRFHTAMIIAYPISKLSFRAVIEYSYENIVLVGKEKQDIIWTFGFAFGN